MSIPKEPRQWMINMMYLVYTALLALNVSAEVINAFFTIDKSIASTNSLITANNVQVLKAMDATIKAKPNYAPLVDAAKNAQGIVSEFMTYIDGVRDNLLEAAGGAFTEEDAPKKMKIGWPRRFKDKDITTRMFVDGTTEADPVGPQVKQKILETREKLVSLVDNLVGMDIKGTNITQDKIESLKSKLALNVNDAIWQETKKVSWSDFTFGHMPVASIYPVLRQYQSDAKNSEAAVINFLFNSMGEDVVEFDKFFPVAVAKKGYILQGETFEADIFLSAFSSQSNNNVSIRVNGSSLPIKEGKAHFTTTPGSTGEKSYEVAISVKSPSGETETFKETYKFEVGKPSSVTVSADKMNVFYIGVKNPVTIGGVPLDKLKVNISGGGSTISNKGGGKFIVECKKPTPAKITVSGGDVKTTSFEFRVKKIPDPVAYLGKNKSGTIGNGTFKAYSGIYAKLEGFDFDAKCNIQGFELTYVAKRQDPISEINRGGSYNSNVKRLVNKAKPGDIYYFDNVKARCPGDIAGRKINSMVFKIK